MKKLFIYYSLTGSGDLVADEFRKKGYEIRKVISKSKYPKNLFLLMMIGGYKAMTDKKDKLINFDSDISAYDKIVIGSPVWNDRISAPINKVLSLIDLTNKDFDFVLYSGSGTAKTALEKIKDLYNKEALVLKEPRKNKKELLKINNI